MRPFSGSLSWVGPPRPTVPKTKARLEPGTAGLGGPIYLRLSDYVRCCQRCQGSLFIDGLIDGFRRAYNLRAMAASPVQIRMRRVLTVLGDFKLVDSLAN